MGGEGGLTYHGQDDGEEGVKVGSDDNGQAGVEDARRGEAAVAGAKDCEMGGWVGEWVDDLNGGLSGWMGG